jgi:hypothetical protein
VRPVDLQAIVSRTQDIEKLQRIQQQHPTLAQEQFSERLRKEAVENQRRVHTAEESLPARIRDGHREKSGRHSAPGDRGGSDERTDRNTDELDAGRDGAVAGGNGTVKGRLIDVKA